MAGRKLELLDLPNEILAQICKELVLEIGNINTGWWRYRPGERGYAIEGRLSDGPGLAPALPHRTWDWWDMADVSDDVFKSFKVARKRRETESLSKNEPKTVNNYSDYSPNDWIPWDGCLIEPDLFAKGRTRYNWKKQFRTHRERKAYWRRRYRRQPGRFDICSTCKRLSEIAFSELLVNYKWSFDNALLVQNFALSLQRRNRQHLVHQIELKVRLRPRHTITNWSRLFTLRFCLPRLDGNVYAFSRFNVLFPNLRCLVVSFVGCRTHWNPQELEFLRKAWRGEARVPKAVVEFDYIPWDIKFKVDIQRELQSHPSEWEEVETEVITGNDH